MKNTYLITAINPDNGKIISTWCKAFNITLAIDKSYDLFRSEYNIKGDLPPILAAVLMDNNGKY